MIEKGLLYQWINFAIFSGALFYFLREPLKNFLGDRRETLRKEIDEVSKERLGVERKFQECKKKMAESEALIQKLKKELRQDGDTEKAALVKNAQAFSEKIRDDAQKVEKQELEKSKFILRKKVLSLAVDLARTMAEKTIDAADQGRLFGFGVQSLERLKDEGKGIG